jgi:hypothetical protein
VNEFYLGALNLSPYFKYCAKRRGGYQFRLYGLSESFISENILTFFRPRICQDRDYGNRINLAMFDEICPIVYASFGSLTLGYESTRFEWEISPAREYHFHFQTTTLSSLWVKMFIRPYRGKS